jgi:hypothetical protein
MQLDSRHANHALRRHPRLLREGKERGDLRDRCFLHRTTIEEGNRPSTQAPNLLIDFSDKMSMNLFKLARCYLKLFKLLDFQSQLPIIDPSLYIHRYCKALDLGANTKGVTFTAIKLIQCMKRD